MLEGKPTIFLSHSERFKVDVAHRFRSFLESLNLTAIIVSESPKYEATWTAEDKVEYYLDYSDAFVALCTPDDQLNTGVVHTRQNIIDELQRARTKPHLRNRVQVFKSPEVDLPTNIDPVYDRLDLADLDSALETLRQQLQAWRFPLNPPSLTELSPPEQPLESQEAIEPFRTGERVDVTTSAKEPDATKQIQAALDRARLLAERPSEMASDEQDTLSGLRILVFTTTAIGASGAAGTLGVHELNRLYVHREALRLSVGERKLILRTMLEGWTAENAPGWFWLQDRDEADIRADLETMARGASDENVQVNSLDLMRHAAIPFETADLRDVYRQLLGGRSTVRASALKYIGHVAGPDAIEVLDEEIHDDTKPAEDALEAKALVLARRDSNEAVALLLAQPDAWSSRINAALTRDIAGLDKGEVERLLHSPNADVREIAIELLGAMEGPLPEQAAELLGDRTLRVRIAAFRALVAKDQPVTPERFASAFEGEAGRAMDYETGRALRVAFEKQRSREELLASLDWYELNGAYAYAALAEDHFSAIEDRLRSDLETEFRDLRDESRARLQERLTEAAKRDAEARFRRAMQPKRLRTPSPEEAERLREELHTQAAQAVEKSMEDLFKESTAAFITGLFLEAALSGIALHGTEADLGFGRKYVRHDQRDVRRQAVRIIARFGSEDDVPALVEAAKAEYGERSAEAAQAALTVAPGVVGVARDLIATNDAGLVRLALASLSTEPRDEVVQLAFPLVFSDSVEVRAAAIDLLIQILDAVMIEKLLSAYVTEQRYYYNVVTRIDRHLYMPQLFQAC